MSVDQLRAALEFRNRVAAEITLRFPRYSVELNDDGERIAGLYFRAPYPDGVDIELITSAGWSYTLFVGTQLWVEDLLFDETKDARVERVVSEIVEGITEPKILELLPSARISRVVSAVLSCIIGIALLAHLVALLILRPIVAAQGVPKDEDQYSGVTHSFEVVLYGQLAGWGFLLLIPLVAVLVFLGVRTIRRGGPAWQQVIGVYSVGAAGLALFVTPWAGLLWAGYGW